MINLIGIVGTGAVESTNRKLLQYMKRNFSTQATIEIYELTNLLFFDKPVSQTAPEIIARLSQKIVEADGVIISTPEYDHTIPAALASLLEWFAYTTQPLRDKPVMITGASYGVLGTSRAQSHLRQILNAPELSGLLMPGREYLLGGSLQAFTAAGELTDVAKKEELDRYFGDFMQFIAKNR